MTICSQCVLPDTFPGISFDDEGRCSYCVRDRGTANRDKLIARYRRKFAEISEDLKGKGPYDVLMAYSGGKDSTYTLRLLKEQYGLKVLAVSFDHGFVSPMALKNILTVTQYLDIDSLSVRPAAQTLRTVFRKSTARDMYPIKALERASSICNSCMSLVKSFMLKSAIEMKVPLVAFGWSPGQAPIQSAVFKTNASMSRQMQKAMAKPIQGIAGDNLAAFFLEERHYDAGEFPYFIHPLALQAYDEAQILDSIEQIGWVNPKDTDANSTNCLLNGFANETHIGEYGFHPYTLEIAGLVREGHMTRDEGLRKLATPSDPKIIQRVKEKLGL